ncbi:MAG: hypothetical protein NC350_06095, partial [Corallococcus sp.]|nr:hypothetical protein [Corallococcus sp.]
IVCFVPLICVLPQVLGIEGILIAAPVADAIAMIVTVIMTIVFFAKLKKYTAAAMPPLGEVK